MTDHADTLELVKALAAIGVVRATFSIEGILTSFEVGPSPSDTVPAPPDDLPVVQDDITAAANRLMGRR